MTRDEITRMAREAGFVGMDGLHKGLCRFAALVAAAEREECIAIHDHEAVLAPVGNSEAHQEGWVNGTSAYRDAIRARGEKGQS